MKSFEDFISTSAAQDGGLEAYLREGPDGEINDYRDLQESALRAYLKLSPGSVDGVVNQIESEYSDAKTAAQGEFLKYKKQCDKQFETESGRAEQIYNEVMEKVKAARDQKKEAFTRRINIEKEEATERAEGELAQFKKNYEYETMISDVVERGEAKKGAQRAAEAKQFTATAKSEVHELLRAAERKAAQYSPEFKTAGELTIKEVTVSGDLLKDYEIHRKRADRHLGTLSRLMLAKLVFGLGWYILAAAVCGLWAFGVLLANTRAAWGRPLTIGIIAVGAVVIGGLMLLIGNGLRKRGRRQITSYLEMIRNDCASCDAILGRYEQTELEDVEKKIAEAKEKHRCEREAAARKYEQSRAATIEKNKALLKAKSEEFERLNAEAEGEYAQQESRHAKTRDEQVAKFKSEYDGRVAHYQSILDEKLAKIEAGHDEVCRRLREFWQGKLAIIRRLIDETGRLDASVAKGWDDPSWREYKPGTNIGTMRFGTIEMDLDRLAGHVKELIGDDLKKAWQVPAVLLFPNRCSLFVQAPHRAREQGISVLKSVMARLFTSVAPGRVHMSIVDPVGLGETFVGFMHAVDYEKALVGGRIWTDSEHIGKCLGELTTHMENVIQKYLRNEYETIEQYNEQAGELAEPYRFLVIADFPANFSDESIRRLGSIINSGPRCGVYTLILSEDSQKMPAGIPVADLAANGVHLAFKGERFAWQSEVFSKFAIKADEAPSEELLTELVCKVGAASVDSTRIEIPFESIAPTDEQMWSMESSGSIKVPIGRAGARRLQYLELGKGVNQHMLIAGKTGSGKSTLLHIIVSNLALWYGPDEVEFYLVDFKQGVEFKTYAVHGLRHARAVAIESDREFGMSILQRLDLEMTIRGEKFRAARVQDIGAYRQATGEKMPRSILIIDEFQVLFAEDDRISHNCTMLLEKLVRQGRAFGIHVILGSQSLAGTAGISRSIMGQMAVRIALQCSELDSQIILNEDNVVARLLARPGEAIYNDAGGMVVGNSPFQVAWLSKDKQDSFLEAAAARSAKLTAAKEPMIVFEGNVAAEIAGNTRLGQLAAGSGDGAIEAFVGEPVTIKGPTAVRFTRHNGANMLVIGQQEQAIAGVMSCACLSVLIQLRGKGQMHILDGGSPDSPVSMKLKMLGGVFDARCVLTAAHKAAELITQLVGEVRTRLEQGPGEPVFLVIAGLGRLRMLYRKEDDWNYRASEEGISVDKMLAEIVREGPAMGVHTIIAADTFNTVERVIDRQTLKEFNNRVLGQMSASDSSNLIDTPLANQLGFGRALLYNEEQGLLEKFRFYAAPDERTAREFARRASRQS